MSLDPGSSRAVAPTPAPEHSGVTITISDISCVNLPRSNIRSHKFYAVVIVNGESQKTISAKRGENLMWGEALQFNVSSTWSMNVQFWAVSTFQKDKLTAESELPIVDSDIQESYKGIIQRGLIDLREPGRIKLAEATVELTVLVIATEEAPKVARTMAVDQANKAIAALSPPSEGAQTVLGALAEAGSAVERFGGVMDSWNPLLKRIGQLVEVTDKIAEIHPYAKMAWSVLSAIPKAFIEQIDRDSRIARLLESMNYAYTFVNAADLLKTIKDRPEVVKRLAQRTTDCAYFIRDYAGQPSLIKRTATHTISDADETATRFEQSFQTLKQAILGLTALNTDAIAQKLVENDDLNQMQYAGGAKDTPKQPCLERTRTSILDEITAWVNLPNTEDVPRVFWLYGVAGSGKSALALTIRDRFSSIGRMGSAFFFDKTFPDRSPSKLFSTISRDIADLIPEWRDSLVKILAESQALRTTLAVKEQWTRFILEPAHAIAHITPPGRRIVIIIDALDEASDSARKIMLDVFKELDKLPPLFRVFVTSRPDDDIWATLHSRLFVTRKDMATIHAQSTHEDVRLYVQHELQPIDGTTADKLVARADGHFQWIVTACRFIKNEEPIHGYGWVGRSRLARLNLVLCAPTEYGLDDLYTAILMDRFQAHIGDEDFLGCFRSVLGQVLYVQQPLTLVAHAQLRGDNEEENGTVDILQSLGSLLQGVSNEGVVPVRPLHTSFRDYLMTSKRSNKFCIRANPELDHNYLLAMACLQAMGFLHFNNCKLDTSYAQNDQVPNLAAQVNSCIPEAVQYACRSWAHHITTTLCTITLLKGLQFIIEEKALFWLEALSVLKEISLASVHLLQLQHWIKDDISDIKDSISDILQFVQMFAGAIHLSAPHIYVSALLFVPQSSKVFQHYREKFRNTLTFKTITKTQWSECLNSLHGHKEEVTSVALSPDGSRIVSGSADKTIQIWDAQSGQALGSPLKGHTGYVYSVAFSPDGSRIVSGSSDNTIRIWDAQIGQALGSPLQGHNGCVRSVAFSPDGSRIVSGSDDKTIQIWDTGTGQPLGNPLEGHSDHVNSVAFSPDGIHIASGSGDHTIQIWDVQRRKMLSCPLQGHSGHVRSVAFSPNGKYIISGSDDKTIRIWDAQSGQALGSPLQGHNDYVSSVAFSSDGNHIVSGSQDKTIWIWDLWNGQALGSPLEGHIGYVLSVACSPDGTHIVSGSDDKTIRIWDAQSGKALGDPLEGHSRSVFSVAFSPDGSRIISGSSDNTIQIWDAQSGQALGNPLKGHDGYVRSVAFSSDGSHIVSGSDDNTIRIWDAMSGKALGSPLKGHSDCVNSVQFSPDGSRIISGSNDKTIQIWDAQSRQALGNPLGGHNHYVSSVAFSPDGSHIASGSFDSTIQIWDAQSGQALGSPLKGHNNIVCSVAFSPDGSCIVSSSGDKTIQIWDVQSGQALGSPLQGHNEYVCSVAFSPDGIHIVSGSFDKTIRIWNAQTRQVLGVPLQGHSACVRSVAFSPNGGYFASSSDDNTIQIWDVQSGQALGSPLNGHSSHMHSAAFSHDSCIVSGSGDSTAHIFNSKSSPEAVPGTSFGLQNCLPWSSPDGVNLVGGCQAHHALLASPTCSGQHPIHFTTEHHDGWLRGPSGELLLWIPPRHRNGFFRPQMLQFIGRKPPLNLDFGRFVHGKSWALCYTPLAS